VSVFVQGKPAHRPIGPRSRISVESAAKFRTGLGQGCPATQATITAGVPQIADELLHRQKSAALGQKRASPPASISALAARPLKPHLLDSCTGTGVVTRDEVQDFVERLVAVR
jgi:hypothetical protein